MPNYQVLKPFNAIRFDTVYQTPVQQYVLVNDILSFDPNEDGGIAHLYRSQDYLGDIQVPPLTVQYWLDNGIVAAAPTNETVGPLSIVTSLPDLGVEGQQALLTTGVLPGLYIWNPTLGQWQNSTWPNAQQFSFIIGLGSTSFGFGYRIPVYFTGDFGFTQNNLPVIVFDPGDGSIPMLEPLATGGPTDDGPTYAYTYGSLGLYTVSFAGNGTGFLDVSEANLTFLNVTGLSSLTGLVFYNNPVPSLDFTGLTALTYLDCYNCTSATSLDFTGLTALTYLDCDSCTSVPSLDFTGLTALTYLDCNSCTSATSLNFSGLTALQTLYCYNCTSATSLDFTGLTALQTLDCNSCIELTTSSVSGCTALSYVDFNGCALSLDTVNGLLSELVANGVSNGFLDISEGTSASPTDTADEATLIANGWSVTTN